MSDRPLTERISDAWQRMGNARIRMRGARRRIRLAEEDLVAGQLDYAGAEADYKVLIGELAPDQDLPQIDVIERSLANWKDPA